jgi:rhomboid protease GluP
MASARKPRNTETLPYEGLSKHQFITLAHEAVSELGWSIRYQSGTHIVALTDNGALRRNAVVSISLEEEGASIHTEAADSSLFNGGINKETIARFIATFQSIKARYTTEELAEKYAVLSKSFPEAEADTLKASVQYEAGNFLSIFKPEGDYVITPLILDSIILIFISMAATGAGIFSPESESLLAWGANFRPYTLAGQWWRLFTSCFIHISIFHLLMNSYALLIIGAQLEPLLGKARFLAAYLFTGIASSIVSLWWHDMTISAGASGAIFGLYGVFLAMLTTNIIEKSVRKQLLSSILVFVAYNLLYGMKGGIDNAAHLGGLLSGLLIGYAFVPGLKQPENTGLKTMSIGITGTLVLALSAYALHSIPNDIGTYDARMEVFSKNEESALSVLNMPKGSSNDAMMAAIEQQGIPRWQENLKLLDEVEALKLPEAVHDRDKMLRRYTELRLKSYELIYRGLKEQTDTYDAELEIYANQTDSVLKILNKG